MTNWLTGATQTHRKPFKSVDPIQRGVANLLRGVFRDMPEKHRTDFILEFAILDYVKSERERRLMAGPHVCPHCSGMLDVKRDGTVHKSKHS